MKGYCQCGKEIDEVEFTQFKMCAECYVKSKAIMPTIKYEHLRIRKGNTDHYYTCNTLVWNYWLNRYYPNAVQSMTVEHLNRGLSINLT